jgi:hypothetical protein
MKPSIVLLAMTLKACSYLQAQDQSCSTVMRTPASSVRFLKEQRDTRQSPCISSVIKQLGHSRYVDAAHVLTSYLDFVDPATLPPSGGTAYLRPDYPAIAALFEIGKPATLDLVSAIQASDSATLRENASKAYMFVYRDDLAAGIHQLKKEKLTARSPDARRRLSEALKMLIDACRGRSEKEAQACKDVT